MVLESYLKDFVRTRLLDDRSRSIRPTVIHQKKIDEVNGFLQTHPGSSVRSRDRKKYKNRNSNSVRFTPYSTRFDSDYFLKSIIRFDSIRLTLYSIRFDSIRLIHN